MYSVHFLEIELKITGIMRYKCDDFMNGTLRLSQTTLAATLGSAKPPKVVFVVNTYFVAEGVKILMKIYDEL